MKTSNHFRFLISFFVLSAFVGCANYKGLIPDKNVMMKNVEVNSPWTGRPIFKAEEIDTRYVERPEILHRVDGP